MERLDVVVVGAGLSGVGAAARILRHGRLTDGVRFTRSTTGWGTHVAPGGAPILRRG